LVLGVGGGGNVALSPLFHVTLPVAADVTPDGRTVVVAAHTRGLLAWVTGTVGFWDAVVVVPVAAGAGTAAT